MTATLGSTRTLVKMATANRDARITMDWICGMKQSQLSEEWRLSPQRIAQIIKRTLKRSGNKYPMFSVGSREAVLIRYRITSLFNPDPNKFDPTTPEGFWLELQGERWRR